MKWSEVLQSGGRGGGGDVYTVHFILHYSDDCQYSGIYSATSQDTQQHREKKPQGAVTHRGDAIMTYTGLNFGDGLCMYCNAAADPVHQV